MKHISKKSIAIGALLTATPLLAQTGDKPNIVLILADDMGYSDIGCYGSEIETPNLNRLAENGLRYSHFYNGARSCPTRAALLTGLFAHQAGIGWMVNAHEGDDFYEGDLSKNAITIGEYLKEGGYNTYISGKWHLTSYRKMNHNIKDNWPKQRGFDRFFGIVGGASNYFTPNVFSDNKEYAAPANFYMTDAVSDSAAVFIRENGDDPFFLYLAYTAPHWPLHAKTTDIEKYDGVYDIGWDKLRNERFKKQKELGLFDDTYSLSRREPTVKAWEGVDAEKKIDFAMRMEIYAAQIDAMDQGIGRVVAALEDAGKLDNTIILFLSDNGACAEVQGTNDRANLTGAADTYESYRINWANASNTPFREYKHYAHEGGIITPLIVHWPEGITQTPGSFVRTNGHLIDIFKTIEDITKIPYPEEYNGNVIRPLQGESLLPDFKGESKVRGPMFWEHEGNLAVRIENWKMVVKTPLETPVGKLELYNLSVDPIEANDLANSNPQKLQELWEAWYEWALEKGVYPIRTAAYAVRQQEDKRYLNGDFDEYRKAGWELKQQGTGQGSWIVDDTGQITGQSSAKVTVAQTGSAPNNINLKWSNLRLKKDERCKVRFKAKADKEITIKVRLEKDHGDYAKVIDTDVVIGTEIKQYEYDSSVLPANLIHQLCFYMGNCPPCTIWLDDVELSFISSPELSPVWNLNASEKNSYTVSFKGNTGFAGVYDHPVPVKISLRKKGDQQMIYHTETFFLNNKQEDFNIHLPGPVKNEEVYPEFEFPPYATKECFIKNLDLEQNGSHTALSDNRDVEDYHVENIGNALLVRQLNSSKNFQIELFDSAGNLLAKHADLKGQTIIPVQNTGVYIIRINEDTQVKKTEKLLL